MCIIYKGCMFLFPCIGTDLVWSIICFCSHQTPSDPNAPFHRCCWQLSPPVLPLNSQQDEGLSDRNHATKPVNPTSTGKPLPLRTAFQHSITSALNLAGCRLKASSTWFSQGTVSTCRICLVDKPRQGILIATSWRSCFFRSTSRSLMLPASNYF